MFTNQTTSSLSDLVDKLGTFLTTAGWTVTKELSDGIMAVERNNVRVVLYWDLATPNQIGVAQFEGAAYVAFSGGVGTSPWLQNNDSGNGAASRVNSVIDGGRYYQTTNTPVQFWCFENDTYFYVVTEISSGNFRHLHVGTLTKTGTWTGGEFAAGQLLVAGVNKFQTNTGNQTSLDGVFLNPSGAPRAPTIHAEGLPGQGGSDKWLVVGSSSSAADHGTDRAGNDRALAIGGRGGLFGYPTQMRFADRTTDGFLPLSEMRITYVNGTDLYVLGSMPDIFYGSMRSFAVAQEVTQGSDTYRAFPLAILDSTDSGVASAGTGYAAFFYRQVNT